jgi:sigma-E factor negative regulatory protein RseC
VIEREAQVVACDGDRITVSAPRQTACGGCEARSGCGISVLGTLFGRRTAEVTLPAEPGLSVGDRVVIGLDEAVLLRGAFTVYLLPLGLMLLAGGVGELLARQAGMASDIPALIAAVAGFAGGLFLAAARLRQPRLTPGHFLRRAGPEDQPPGSLLSPAED